MDMAELTLKVNQAGVAETTAGLNNLSAAAGRASATTADFARAGATANQIAQLTGVSVAQARNVVATFGGTAAETAIEVQGLALAKQKAAAANIELGAAASASNLGLGRLRQSMATLAAESLGLNPIAGRLGSTMAGAFGAGSIAIIALLGGIVATRAVYNAWHEDADRAKEEQDKLTDALQKWYDKTREGPAGDLTKQIDAMTKKVHDLKIELDGVTSSSFWTRVGSEAGMIGAGGSFKNALIRIFTAGDLAHMALQAGLEVNKGTAATVKQVKDGTDAIVAAKAESARRIAEANEKIAAAELNLVMPKLARSVTDMLKARDEATNYAREASDQARLDALSGTARDIMAARIKAEGEQRKANAEFAGDSLSVEQRPDSALAIVTDALQKWYDKTKQRLLEAEAVKELADRELYLDDVRKHLKPAKLLPTDTVAIGAAALADASKKAIEEQQAIVDTALKDEQRAFAVFFDSIFTKGTASFRDLFNTGRDLFFKMLADIAAADVMKKIAAPMAAVIGGMLGMPSAASAQGVMPGGVLIPAGVHSTAATIGAGAMIAGAGFGFGSMIGGLAQHAGLGEAGAGLGGAAGGAALGAGIGALGGPIGVAAGAFIGGVAGAVGGLLGFTHSASEAAKAMLQFRTQSDSVSASLLDWQAQISGTAADQKAAALMDLQVKYDEIQQTINQSLAGKKHEKERNAQLSEAASLYDKNKTAIENNTAAWLQSTGAINDVQGYRYQADYFASLPIVAGSASGVSSPTPPPPYGGATSTDKSGGNLTINLTLDGKVVATTVLTRFQDTSKRLNGDKTKWSEITRVS